MKRGHATAAVACALAVLGTHCSSISSDAHAPLAIEFVLPHFTSSFTVQEFDTLPIEVHVLDNAGDTIPGARVQVVSFAPDTLAVDTQPLALIGLRPGHSRLVATSGNLRSDPLAVTVVRAPDSLAIASPGTDTVAATDSASAPLVVDLLDLRTDTTQAIGLSGYPVVFAIVYPPFASPAAAAVGFENDTLATLVDTVTTSGGAASVNIKRRGPAPQPDSIVVRASASRANGTVVHGSPILFVVRFK
ncbi:MAG: hypothetical protein ABSG61_06670 [Gemmatimonadales bacterium]